MVSKISNGSFAWQAKSAELAIAAMPALVNRTDAYTRYFVGDDGRVKTRKTAREVDARRLQSHFLGSSVDTTVSLPLSSRDEMCKWVALDIDVHKADPDPDLVRSVDLFSKNRLAMLAPPHGITDDAILIDSNGRGGRHLFVRLEEPIILELAWGLAQTLAKARDRRNPIEYEIPEVECFPKSPALAGMRYGTALRLPGRSPKRRDHWSKVWQPDGEGGGRWLGGTPAVNALLKFMRPGGGFSRSWAWTFARDEMNALDAQKEEAERQRHVDKWEFDVDELEENDPRLVAKIRRCRSALDYIAEKDKVGAENFEVEYDDWILIGLSLRELGHYGLQLWDEFSRKIPKYKGPEDVEVKWNTFGYSGDTTLGTLFDMAIIPDGSGKSRITTEWVVLTWTPRGGSRSNALLKIAKQLRRSWATRLSLGLFLRASSVRRPRNTCASYAP